MLDRRFHFGELICCQFPQIANELYGRDRDDVLSVEGPFLQERSPNNDFEPGLASARRMGNQRR